jgi:hypothetical protein
MAASFSQSITPAMSMLLGQRVVQVSHEEHTQMVRQPKTCASCPKSASRMTWSG